MFDLLLIGLIQGLLIGSVYAFIAGGFTLIYGVTEIVDFCHGEFLMLAMYLTFWLSTLSGTDPYLSILVTVPVLFAIGWITMKVIFVPSLKKPQMTQLLLAIGIMYILQNLALWWWSPDWRIVNTPYSDLPISLGLFATSLPRLIASIASIILTIVLHLFLKNSKLGKAIRATSQNSVAAELVGVNIERIYLVTYGIGLAMTAVAGTCISTFQIFFPTVGARYIPIVFAIVILGGLGNFTGAFFGGLTIGVAETLGSVIFGQQLAGAMAFIVTITILSLIPEGLPALFRRARARLERS